MTCPPRRGSFPAEADLRCFLGARRGSASGVCLASESERRDRTRAEGSPAAPASARPRHGTGRGACSGPRATPRRHPRARRREGPARPAGPSRSIRAHNFGGDGGGLLPTGVPRFPKHTLGNHANKNIPRPERCKSFKFVPVLSLPDLPRTTSPSEPSSSLIRLSQKGTLLLNKMHSRLRFDFAYCLLFSPHRQADLIAQTSDTLLITPGGPAKGQ